MSEVLVVHISPELTSFVRKDIEILSTAYHVSQFFYRGRKSVPSLARRVLSSDVTFSWFAWDHAAWTVRMSRVLGKRSIVIVGGFDVASVPEISYGNLLNPSSAKRTLYALNRANTALAVSESTREEAVRFSGKKDIQVVHHGFDSEKYYPEREKRRQVISVGDVSPSNMKRKGLATFVEAAKLLPEVRFLLVGYIHQDVRSDLGVKPGNLEVTGRVPDSELLNLLQSSKVYVQVSAHEGFGCSLAEAMLCECVPVVTSKGALPEVVGDTGEYVPFGDPKATAGAIERVLEEDSMGKMARERILTNFPLEKRSLALIKAVEDLL